MTIRHPKALKRGDKVALLSPAGPVPGPETVEQCRKVLEDLGFEVAVGKSAALRFDYMAGTDEQRAEDLNIALRDPSVRGIFCTRGGYSSGRLLPLLDYQALIDDPKLFAGFSDLTCIHCAFRVKANLATFHSATLAMAFLSDSRLTPESRALYLKQIFETLPVGSVRKAMGWNDPVIIKKGTASGELVGGNLANFAAMVGTPYLPAPEGKILFLEEVGEEPYKVDRMINQLDQCGYLSKINGLILGQFTDAEPTDPKREKIEAVLPRITQHLEVPVLANFPAGHVAYNIGLPFGCKVELDAAAGDVVLKQALCGN